MKDRWLFFVQLYQPNQNLQLQYLLGHYYHQFFVSSYRGYFHILNNHAQIFHYASLTAFLTSVVSCKVNSSYSSSKNSITIIFHPPKTFSYPKSLGAIPKSAQV